MKVLFLSNTAGQGHHSTANALEEVLTSRGVECKIIDTYAYLNPVLYETVARGYLMATSITPGAYGGFYRAAEKKRISDSMHTPVNVANSVMSIKLRKYFEREFNPDVIVCTHVFSAEVVNVMKAKGQLNAPVIGVVTDFTIHPFWKDVSHIDYFVTASELLSLQAEKQGIKKEQLLPFGIPINQRFSSRTDKIEARRQLGIDENKRTVLLMSGSMGYGNISHMLAKIDDIDVDFQIIAVCGNNRHAKHKIERMETQKDVYCYGYVNNVDLMMDASDCIVTKPGGLTTSEALAKNLPIVMVNPIPGQEERNVEFMLNNGLAVYATSTAPIDEVIYQLFLYPEKFDNMIENIKLVGKPNSSGDLCDFIMNLNKNK